MSFKEIRSPQLAQQLIHHNIDIVRIIEKEAGQISFMFEISHEQLNKEIIKELGKRNTAVYERDENWVVEVPEDNEDDAIEIIEEAGWEILDQEGYAFTIK